jgi:hypothetical protein
MIPIAANVGVGGGKSGATSGKFHPVFGSDNNITYAIGAIGAIIVIGIIIVMFKKKGK